MKTRGNDLVTIMKERAPKGSSLVNLLMEILSMGKEAVYRRLRGEVAFSFDEAAIISREMNISLDQIAGFGNKESVLFELLISNDSVKLEAYYEGLEYFCKIMEPFSRNPDSRFFSALNTVPYYLFSGFDNLLRYRLCRWLCHQEKILLPSQLPNITIPQKILDKHKELSDLFKNIKRSYCIFDESSFLSLINEINYYVSLQLIEKVDLEKMKEELHLMLNQLEMLSLGGTYDNGNEVSLYLSSLYFETSYIYLENKEDIISFFKAYSINTLYSRSPVICRTHKNWIESLRRHSVLISQSGEMQRFTFFAKQHKYVDSM